MPKPKPKHRISCTIDHSHYRQMEDLRDRCGFGKISKLATHMLYILLDQMVCGQMSAPQETAHEIQEEFNRFGSWEDPEYGERTVRHNNRDTYGT